MALVGFCIAGIYAREGWYLAVLWGLACWLVGMLLGFLFGIPRRPGSESNQNEGQGGSTANREGKTKPHGFSHVNSNLEKVSDWLTSIIIGLSLVELRDIPGGVDQLSRHIASGFGNGTGGPVSFATSLIIYFLVLGFCSGYLLTRVYLSIAFKDVDCSADPNVPCKDTEHSAGAANRPGTV
ncbi:MAG: hypothetical protein JSW34_06380 [Candidatus Zixiibacteriota bacterium]|nr:MAG: hypothetical protein JSW34_06380 [candidate division Zixibacteria bacterium]